jgi:sugar phosphate isomerase/epimerase
MHYGICGGPEIAGPAAQAGFAFFEWTVAGLLKPREDGAAFIAALDVVRGAALPCPVVNCFIPADLKITGPAVDKEALRRFVTTAFARAQKARVDTIVLGSGGARSVPAGFSHEKATDQIADFCVLCAPLAADHAVTVVLEPLNRRECNILTSVRETAGIVNAVNHPAIRLLVDAYHWAMENDSVQDIVTYGSLIRHAHIATVPNRKAPGLEEYDFAPFFRALTDAGYAGRISIEGAIPDPARDLPKAYKAIADCLPRRSL